jgi:hypothetical protein
MQALTAQQLLPIWESGRAQMPVQRALTVLAAACPESSVESLAALSIGRRDASLLQLREWAFGPRLDAISHCPQCGERLEFSFTADDIRPGTGNELADAATLAVENYEINFRLPNSFDLMAVATCGSKDRKALRQMLTKRCVLQACHQDAEIAAEQLPESVVTALSRHMAEADQQADIRLALDCPNCQHRWEALFDILSFFWGEIDAWAGRMVREVHLLASAYGWAEKDILTMSPDRRLIYLSMLAT